MVMKKKLLVIAALALTVTSLHAQTGALPKLLPGTRPNVLSTIEGNAVSSTNGSLPNTLVRLRDVRSGRIFDTTITDKTGAFAFRGVDPGSYIVEMMSPANDVVLASSPMMHVGAGEAVSALVKLPFRIPALAGLLGNAGQTTASAVSTAAQAVTAAAASSNTVAAALAGEPATSQNPSRR
jgi:hypothetical protein